VDDSPLQILMLEDHQMVAAALADALRANGFDVVGITDDGDDAVRRVQQSHVDIVILDLRLGEIHDASVYIPRIIEGSPDTKVLVLSAWNDDWSVARAVEAGCHGYLVKDQSVSDLIAALHAVARGEAVFAPTVMTTVLKLLRPGSTSSESLTPRETEVLQRLADGATTELIATDLFVSVNTVRNHIHNIIRKLNVHSRLEAVAAGIRNGLIQVH
jgi:DNA-binding NarL/FixJ family response regulator